MVQVVVHPEAAHHISGLVGGWYDSELSAKGRRHADVIAQALRQERPTATTPEVFCSDLVRARQTATPIAAAFDVSPTYDWRLREKSYGAAEGRPQDWLDARFVAPPVVGDRMTHAEGVDGAETRAEFAARIYAAMDDIVASPSDHQIIVTHGFALTFIVASWIKMPVAALGYVNFLAAPGSITTLREDEYFHNRQVVTLSSIEHLT